MDLQKNQENYLTGISAGNKETSLSLKLKAIFGIAIFALTFILSCDMQNNELYKIKNLDDLLFLAEDTNLKTLTSENWDSLLFDEEKAAILNGKFTLKIVEEEVFNRDDIVVRLILKEGNLHFGRHYEFFLRSYSISDNKIIGNHLISSYIEDRELCLGSLHGNLFISVECELLYLK